jgi:hypothetical protein
MYSVARKIRVAKEQAAYEIGANDLFTRSKPMKMLPMKIYCKVIEVSGEVLSIEQTANGPTRSIAKW